MEFYVHNGYLGWSYGTPTNPQLVSAEDAERLMRMSGVTMEQLQRDHMRAAQYAKEGDSLFHLTGGNRFLVYGDIRACAGLQTDKIATPLAIIWPEAAE
jgi:hypothetical protein